MLLFTKLLATAIAISWVHFAKDYYGYKHAYLTILGMNSLALMDRTLTLLGLGEVCNHIKMSRKIYCGTCLLFGHHFS
jgi:hypothetical protein